MAQVGSLAVRVSANTRPYQQGMRDTRGPAQKMRRSMNQVARRAGKMSAAIAAAGAAITAHLVRSGLEAVDTQQKLARQMGTTQAQIAGVTRAAKDAGIEAGQLESNLQALNKRLGEAQEGTGAAADAMDKLGLSAQELAEMPLDQRLDTIGAAINNLDTQTEKAAATADLFSRSGLEMMNVFSQGAGAIQRATDEAQQFGIAVEGIDARQVEAANDAMDRIGDVIQGVSNQLAVELAPILQGIAELLTENARETKGFTDQISEGVDTGISAIAFLADAVEGVRRVFVIAGQAAATAALAIQKEMFRAADIILGGPVHATNALIRAMNNIPGINMDEFEPPEIAQEMRAKMEEADRAVQEGQKAMHETLMEPMPSESIERWVSDVKMRSAEAASAIEDARARVDAAHGSAGGGGGEGDNEGEEDEARREAIQRRLEYLTEGLNTEREIKQEHFEKELERLREQNEMMLITEEEYRKRNRELEIAHWGKMAGIRESSLNALTSMVGDAYGKQAAMVTSALQDIVTSTSKHSKTAFEIQKKVAIANAVVKGWEAATSAWAAGMSVGGPYAPLVAAAYTAASLAKTGAQIASIKSQSFSGGSGGSTGAGGAGGVPTTGGGSVPGTGGGAEEGGRAPTRTVINIEGGDNATFSGRQVRGLIESINEELDGGMILRKG